MSATFDKSALLCALVLAPSTYSRNRFFQLYQEDEIRGVRRRAAIIRNLVKQCVRSGSDPEIHDAPSGYELRLSLREIKLERRTLLEPLELSLFRYMLAKNRGERADADRQLIESALARLAGGGV